MQLLGMVGFGEGLWTQMIGELCLGTFIVAVLTLVALVRRSHALAVAALLVNVVVALLYFPWQAFYVASSDDTDWQSLLTAWQIAATWWAGVSIAAVTITLWLFARAPQRSPKAPDAKPSKRLPELAKAGLVDPGAAGDRPLEE